MVETCFSEARGRQVMLSKCNSHLDRLSLAALIQTPCVTRGNDLADKFAQIGVEKVSEDIDPEVRELARGEFKAWLAQRRLAIVNAAAACAEYERKSRPRKVLRVPAAWRIRKELETSSGHQLSRVGSSWVCSHCQSGPGKFSVLDWLRDGKCPGPQYHRVESQGRPVRLPPRFRIGDKEMHESHNAAILYGQIFCWRCGCLGSKTPSGGRLGASIVGQCRGHPTPAGQEALNKIQRWEVPSTKVKATWPDGTPNAPRQQRRTVRRKG